MSPEAASYDPEEFVDGSQSWPRLLALKDGELLAKGEVFEHQTAARPKQAKHGSEPEPKQVKHGNQVIADPLVACPTKLLISQPDRIVMRHSMSPGSVCRHLKIAVWVPISQFFHVTSQPPRKLQHILLEAVTVTISTTVAILPSSR